MVNQAPNIFPTKFNNQNLNPFTTNRDLTRYARGVYILFFLRIMKYILSTTSAELVIEVVLPDALTQDASRNPPSHKLPDRRKGIIPTSIPTPLFSFPFFSSLSPPGGEQTGEPHVVINQTHDALPSCNYKYINNPNRS